MPKSVASYYSTVNSSVLRDDDENESQDRIFDLGSPETPASPVWPRRTRSTRTLEEYHGPIDENSSLLGRHDGASKPYRSIASTTPGTPKPPPQRRHSRTGSVRLPRTFSRTGSFSARLVNALSAEAPTDQHIDHNLSQSKESMYINDRVWYDQFTSTDWVHDNIADAFRVKALRNRKDFRGRVIVMFDAVQGWILVAIIGCITAMLAYFITRTEGILFELKEGYCSYAWYLNRKKCCNGATECDLWNNWSNVVLSDTLGSRWVDYAAYVLSVLGLATLSCLLTLLSKTVIPSAVSLSTLDENL